jgi:Ca-activated chloride channel homolog
VQKILVSFVIISALLLFVTQAYSDGILIPVPPIPRPIELPRIAIKYHKVNVDINNQIATTSVDQVFVNESAFQLEATYIFPLPAGVTINEFIMYDEKGNPLKAELLNSDQARQIYEDIVRQMKDPAILEYLGTGAFRARIFPILPWGEKRIQIQYTEVLKYDSGIYKYNYPLNTEKFSSKPLEEVDVNVELKSNIPIKSIWSPSYEGSIQVDQEGDNFARVIYADENNLPDKDFLLYYTVSNDDVGLSLLTYKEPSEDGFYVFLAAPKHNISTTEVVGKNVIFVFDTSGSMSSDDKIGQARKALEFCVSKLNKKDNFNVIDFSTSVRKFKPNPVSGGNNEIESALKYIRNLDATGGTDINNALIEAIKQLSLVDNPINMIIFLTDGQPTVGVTDEQKIIKNIELANNLNARLFVFGVGYDVNTRLLDELATSNRGISTYVRPGEDIEIIVSDFFSKVSTPVLSSLMLDFGSINTFERYPTELPDLFAGSQVKEFGRYRNIGKTNIKLSGTAEGKPEVFTYQANFPVENTTNKFISQIWAARKVGYLIEQVRKNGATQEIIDEIRNLSIKYGIVNEYVSMLILEDQPPMPGGFEGQFANEVGKAAVDASVAVQNSKDTVVIQSGNQGGGITIVAGKTFIKKGNIWIDAEYRDKNPTVVLQYESDSYFAFLAKYPDLGKYFAIGKEVIVYYNGEIYRVQEEQVSPVEPKDKSQTLWGEVKSKVEFLDFILGQNYPNPFNPQTWIPYSLATDSVVVISIYNIEGTMVRKLDIGHKPAGDYTSRHVSAFWDGKNSAGEDVSSGIYFYVLETEKFKSVKKMMLKR